MRVPAQKSSGKTLMPLSEKQLSMLLEASSPETVPLLYTFISLQLKKMVGNKQGLDIFLQLVYEGAILSS